RRVTVADRRVATRPAAMLRDVRTSAPASVDGSAADDLVAAIAHRLPGTKLLTEPIDRESYRTDETPYLHAGLPRAIVFPTTTVEVAELVRIAAGFRVPVVPRGAGTGLSGGASGIEGCLTI